MALLALIFLVENNWRHGVVFNRVVGTAIALLGCAVLINPDVLGIVSGATAAPSSGM